MVEKYYAQGNIYSTIISLLDAAGKKTNNLTRKDIAAVDEFHIGGQQVTRELAKQCGMMPGMHVLDIGCGLGGPCRLFTDEFGCEATGIDITAEYIDTARRLTELTGINEGINFVQGSATDLPFADQYFDICWTQHVQMNIADKHGFYTEANRVLKPGGLFVYYDVFSTGDDQPVYFPLPWADGPSMNHLITIKELNEHFLTSAGLQELNNLSEKKIVVVSGIAENRIDTD